ncbi:MAG: hypothetical protein QOF91_3626 [Alphaproteobacteria bacterium]|jgi:hypothetical protein|nr:hypothetical protein [Alphaproteobacteria bacterium]
MMRAPVLPVGLIVLALALPTFAADLPLKPARPARPAAPASATPLAAPSPACLEWTDGCRVCQRTPNGEASCSNVGIACVPKAEECTRR